MKKLLRESISIWDRLASETRPIVLYGMGDGADKILNILELRGIPASGVFASDDFVRGQSFRGFRVETLAQIEKRLGEVVILLSFASQRPEVLAQIREVEQRHTLLAPEVPVYGEALFDMAFLKEHEDSLVQVYDALSDEVSRHTLRCILEYRISGKLCYLWESATPREELYSILNPGPNEIFVDGGAYTGDTVAEFLEHTEGCFEKIVALEPDRRNFTKLSATVEKMGHSNIQCLNLGLWKERDTLSFRQSTGRQNALCREGPPNTPVDSLDHILAGEKATILKLDVEGAEREALLGAQETIARHRPSMILSAYHRTEDLFALPLLALELYGGKQPELYLRRPPYVPPWDIVYLLK